MRSKKSALVGAGTGPARLLNTNPFLNGSSTWCWTTPLEQTGSGFPYYGAGKVANGAEDPVTHASATFNASEGIHASRDVIPVHQVGETLCDLMLCNGSSRRRNAAWKPVFVQQDQEEGAMLTIWKRKQQSPLTTPISEGWDVHVLSSSSSTIPAEWSSWVREYVSATWRSSPVAIILVPPRVSSAVSPRREGPFVVLGCSSMVLAQRFQKRILAIKNGDLDLAEVTQDRVFGVFSWLPSRGDGDDNAGVDSGIRVVVDVVPVPAAAGAAVDPSHSPLVRMMSVIDTRDAPSTAPLPRKASDDTLVGASRGGSPGGRRTPLFARKRRNTRNVKAGLEGIAPAVAEDSPKSRRLSWFRRRGKTTTKADLEPQAQAQAQTQVPDVALTALDQDTFGDANSSEDEDLALSPSRHRAPLERETPTYELRLWEVYRPREWPLDPTLVCTPDSGPTRGGTSSADGPATGKKWRGRRKSSVAGLAASMDMPGHLSAHALPLHSSANAVPHSVQARAFHSSGSLVPGSTDGSIVIPVSGFTLTCSSWQLRFCMGECDRIYANERSSTWVSTLSSLFADPGEGDLIMNPFGAGRVDFEFDDGDDDDAVVVINPFGPRGKVGLDDVGGDVFSMVKRASKSRRGSEDVEGKRSKSRRGSHDGSQTSRRASEDTSEADSRRGSDKEAMAASTASTPTKPQTRKRGRTKIMEKGPTTDFNSTDEVRRSMTESFLSIERTFRVPRDLMERLRERRIAQLSDVAKGKVRILNLDGGGLRGVIEGVILERLVMVFPDFLETVDVFSGTSVGALNAMLLARGFYPQIIRRTIAQHGKVIFTMKSKFALTKAQHTNKFLSMWCNLCCGGLKLKELRKKIIIPAFKLDNQLSGPARSWETRLYHNLATEYESEADGEAYGDILADELLMRTTAAPTYFPSYGGCIDGGMYANNNTIGAVALVTADPDLACSRSDLVVLSLGTGCPENSLEDSNHDWGIMQWLPRIADATMDGAQYQTNDLARLLLGDAYHRVNPVFDKAMPMNNPKLIAKCIKIAESIDLSETIEWVRREWYCGCLPADEYGFAGLDKIGSRRGSPV